MIDAVLVIFAVWAVTVLMFWITFVRPMRAKIELYNNLLTLALAQRDAARRGMNDFWLAKMERDWSRIFRRDVTDMPHIHIAEGGHAAAD